MKIASYTEVSNFEMNLNEYAQPKGGWREELSQSRIEKIREDKITSKRVSDRYGSSYEGKFDFIRSTAEQVENVLVNVHYATNREPSGGNEIFSSTKVDKVSYGIAKVSIPKNIHKSGRVERPSEYFKFILREDKNKHFVIDSGNYLEEEEFFDTVNTASEGKSIMIFVHGYNVNFKDAVFKSTQIKYDLNYAWPILLFSWPSKAKVKSYVSDKENSLYSSSALQHLLEKVSDMNIEEVVVIGHSMGAFCLAEALKSFTPTNNSFKRLALAAADIQKDEFVDSYSMKIKRVFELISLYMSSSDKALIASDFVNESERVGDSRGGVLVVKDIESIDMSDADNNLFSLGHSYVSESNKALDDLYHFLVNGLSADKRRLKELVNKESLKYWSLHE